MNTAIIENGSLGVIIAASMSNVHMAWRLKR